MTEKRFQGSDLDQGGDTHHFMPTWTHPFFCYTGAYEKAISKVILVLAD